MLFFALQLWQIHNAEQMIMDDMELNPDKYKGKKLTELTDDDDFDEENSVVYGEAYYKKTLLPKMTMVKFFHVVWNFYFLVVIYMILIIHWQRISTKELDLESALAERQVCIRLFVILSFICTVLSTHQIVFYSSFQCFICPYFCGICS